MRLNEFFKQYEPIDQNISVEEYNLLRYLMIPKTDSSVDVKRSMFPEDRIWTVILDNRLYIVPGSASQYSAYHVFGTIICKEPWANSGICVEIVNLVK